MSYLGRLAIRLLAVLLMTVLSALAASSWLTVDLFEPRLAPEIEKSTQTLGRSLAALFARASSYRVALEGLVGVDEVFKSAKDENPQVGVIAVTDRRGSVLHIHGQLTPALSAYLRSGNFRDNGSVSLDRYQVTSLPLQSPEGVTAGYLHIGSDKAYVRSLMRETLLDVLVVLVVSLFLAVEVIYFLSGTSRVARFRSMFEIMNGAASGDFSRRCEPGPESSGFVEAVNAGIDRVNAAYRGLFESFRDAWRGRRHDGGARVRAAIRRLRGLRERYRFSGAAPQGGEVHKLGVLRAPLFLFLVADDLARSFIPVYAAELYTPLPGVPEKLVVGLPIMAFMMVIALLQPLAGAWSERVGHRVLLIAGALMGAASHLGSANAVSIYDFLLWRVLAGTAWALIFVAGQAYVLEHAGPRNRVRGLAYFVGIISVASICGPSIGGILADGIGFRRVFWVAAALTALAAWVIWTRIPARRQDPARAGRRLRLSDFAAIATNARFAVLLFFAAIPAKIVLIAYCYYLIPLYVIDQGGNTAMAGRIIMLYSLIMVFGVPLVAAWSKVPQRCIVCVTAGLVISGVAGLLPALWPGVWTVAATVLLLGVAQSVSIAPQGAMVGDLCQREIVRFGEGPVYGTYRLIERLGNALGPILGAGLLVRAGFEASFGGIGLLLLVCAAVFSIAFLAPARFRAEVSS